jgi:hypothetical protein
LKTPVKVYNFEVEDFHTYYVSELNVLVHNTCDGSGGSLNIDKEVLRQAKKLSPEAKIGYENAINALAIGDLRGLNNHGLKGNRKGQWAIDIKGSGRNRGDSRLIYTKNKDGSINVIEYLTDHKKY